MTEDRSPPPEAEACLCRRYASSQKGGTLIAEDVTDLAEHERRLRGARYRPPACPTCGGRMHVHDQRSRCLLAHPAVATVISRFRCAEEQCRAVWQVVPAFLARHLWRAWETVQDVILDDGSESAVPERTQARWRARAASAARKVIATLATAGTAAMDAVIGRAGLRATRCELITVYAALVCSEIEGSLESLAAMVHRLAPGVRVM